MKVGKCYEVTTSVANFTGMLVYIAGPPSSPLYNFFNFATNELIGAQNGSIFNEVHHSMQIFPEGIFNLESIQTYNNLPGLL